MFSLFAGTFVLAIVHALIPNHWLPLVAVAKAEHWKKKDIVTVTLFSATAHVLGTVALGFILGLIGKELRDEYGHAITIAASILLIIFGLVYYTINLPHHHHSSQKDVAQYKRSKTRWIFIFIFMMFLSPCLEVESLFLSAGAYGMSAVIFLSLIYGVVSISGILLLVSLGYKGIHLLNASFIEHNEKKISGIVLIAVGIISFFLN